MAVIASTAPLRTCLGITSASLQFDISTFAYKASASSTLGCIWCEWNWKHREARNEKHHPIFVHFWEGQAQLNEWMYRHVDVDWIFGELLLGRFAVVPSDTRQWRLFNIWSMWNQKCLLKSRICTQKARHDWTSFLIQRSKSWDIRPFLFFLKWPNKPAGMVFCRSVKTFRLARVLPDDRHGPWWGINGKMRSSIIRVKNTFAGSAFEFTDSAFYHFCFITRTAPMKRIKSAMTVTTMVVCSGVIGVAPSRGKYWNCFR